MTRPRARLCGWGRAETAPFPSRSFYIQSIVSVDFQVFVHGACKPLYPELQLGRTVECKAEADGVRKGVPGISADFPTIFLYFTSPITYMAIWRTFCAEQPQVAFGLGS